VKKGTGKCMVVCKYCKNIMKKDVECNPFTGMKYEVKFVCHNCWSSSPPCKDENEIVATQMAYDLATVE
jgi:predicted metal-binding protein